MTTPERSVKEIAEELPKHYSNVRCSHDNPMVPLKAVIETLQAERQKREGSEKVQSQKAAYKAFWWLTENHEWALTNLDIALMLIDPETDSIVDNTNKNTKHQYWLETGPFVDEEIDGKVHKMLTSHDYQLDCGGDTFEEAICFLAKNVESVYGKKTDMYGEALTHPNNPK